jgi:integrase
VDFIPYIEVIKPGWLSAPSSATSLSMWGLTLANRSMLKDAGLPHIHFHDLQHSVASILLCMGVSMSR